MVKGELEPQLVKDQQDLIDPVSNFLENPKGLTRREFLILIRGAALTGLGLVAVACGPAEARSPSGPDRPFPVATATEQPSWAEIKLVPERTWKEEVDDWSEEEMKMIREEAPIILQIISEVPGVAERPIAHEIIPVRKSNANIIGAAVTPEFIEKLNLKDTLPGIYIGSHLDRCMEESGYDWRVLLGHESLHYAGGLTHDLTDDTTIREAELRVANYYGVAPPVRVVEAPMMYLKPK